MEDVAEEVAPAGPPAVPPLFLSTYSVDHRLTIGPILDAFGAPVPGKEVIMEEAPLPRRLKGPYTMASGDFSSDDEDSDDDSDDDPDGALDDIGDADMEAGAARADVCVRIGALTVLRWGRIVRCRPGYHTPRVLYPVGYRAVRVFWGPRAPSQRSLYVCEVQPSREVALSEGGQVRPLGRLAAIQTPMPPVFVITSVMDPTLRVTGRDPEAAFKELKVQLASRGVLDARLCLTASRGKKSATVQSGAAFFGVSLPGVQSVLEALPHATEAMIIPKGTDWPKYTFQYYQPTFGDILDARAKRDSDALRLRSNPTGCARTEKYGRREATAAPKSGGVRRVADNADPLGHAEEDVGTESRASLSLTEHEPVQLLKMYKQMKEIPLEERVQARRSPIHGWGLFTLQSFAKNHMIVEYCGEVIRQPVGDRREIEYEKTGASTCYLFRLDKDYIVDATNRGCCARFINHSCDPNSYSKIIAAESEKKIVIFALRDLGVGEEVTYDYKFPFEEEKIPCRCGAKNCRGRMN